MGNTFKCGKQQTLRKSIQNQIITTSCCPSDQTQINSFVPAKPLLAQQTGIKCKTKNNYPVNKQNSNDFVQEEKNARDNSSNKTTSILLQQQEEEENNKLLSLNNIQDCYFDKDELIYYNSQLSKFKKGKRFIGKKISWKQGDLIGSGSFGKVYKGLNLATGELIAIKQLVITGNFEEKKSKKKILEHEIELLSTLKHKNIVKYYGIEKDKEVVNIFLEHVSGGSLQSMLKKFGRLNENLIRLYTKQIIEGLEYLHVNEVLHRDIKGANVLIKKNGTAKLSDFGSAKRIVVQLNNNVQTQTMTGTPNWFFLLFLQGQQNGARSYKIILSWKIF